MELAQIIEALQINNLPHLPHGDFIITEKLQQSILSLLSQQQTIEQIAVAAAKYGFDYRDNSQHQGEVPEGNVLQWLQWYLSTNPKSLLSQQAVVEQTDEEALREFLDYPNPATYETYKKAKASSVCAFLAGRESLRQQLSTQFQSRISNASYLTNLQKELLLKDLTK